MNAAETYRRLLDFLFCVTLLVGVYLRWPADPQPSLWLDEAWRAYGAVNQHDGELAGDPTVTTRGFVVDDRTDSLLREVPEVVRTTIESASVEERTDRGVIQENVRMQLQRFFRKRAGRRPLVLPVIMEI